MVSKLRQITALVMTFLIVICFSADFAWAIEDDFVACGSCGYDLEWTLDWGGTLEIFGTGEMYDYCDEITPDGGFTRTSEDQLPPWNDYYDQIFEVVVYEGVETIGVGAFDTFGSELYDEEKPMAIQSVQLPSSLYSIGVCAFSGCESLNKISLPDGITSIEANTFSYCYNLKSVDIPDSVSSIGNGAFFHCVSLTGIDLPDGLESIGYGAFMGCEGLSSITIPDSVQEIDENAFCYCSNLSSVTLPKNISTIKEYTFAECSNLERIEIPDGVYSIEEYAFESCDSLIITIPDSVYYIDPDAFSYSNNVVITGNSGSYAEEYADANNIEFVATGEGSGHEGHQDDDNDGDVFVFYNGYSIYYEYSLCAGEMGPEIVYGNSYSIIPIEPKDDLILLMVLNNNEDDSVLESYIIDENDNIVYTTTFDAYYNGRVDRIYSYGEVDSESYVTLWYDLDLDNHEYRIVLVNSGSDYINCELLMQELTCYEDFAFGDTFQNEARVCGRFDEYDSEIAEVFPYVPKTTDEANCFLEFVNDNDNFYLEFFVVDENDEPLLSKDGSECDYFDKYCKKDYNFEIGKRYYIVLYFPVDNDYALNQFSESYSFSIKSQKYSYPLRVKSLWASRHDVGRVLFKWTKKEGATDTGWNLKYRVRKIGAGGYWSDWLYEEDFPDMEAVITYPSDWVVEIHAQAVGDTTWSTGIITTPAGGKYQAMKYTHVINATTGKRLPETTVKGSDIKHTAIKLKVGQTLKVKPDYEYPVKNYTARPRLYPSHMLYDIGDKSIITITKPDGSTYTGGIIDGTATIKATKAGKTTIIFRSPNGRTMIGDVTVTN